MTPRLAIFLGCCLAAAGARADEPGASYIFPPGGQHGTTVAVRVGALCLFSGAPWEMTGPGIAASGRLEPAETIWFEGPLIPLPASQQREDYPKDYAATIAIAPDAPLGVRYWRTWNSQGVTPAMKFVVGDLPEVVEQEIDGEPLAVPVQLPVTINGRVFPREDVDLWSFTARAGETVALEAVAARLGSPLDSVLQVLDASGRVMAENGDWFGPDSFVQFTAPADGTYLARIHDAAFGGLQPYVYRLTISAAPRVDSAYPLGGRRGGPARFELAGHGLPSDPVDLLLPADGAADYSTRIATAAGETNPLMLELDDLPEVGEAEPNDVVTEPMPRVVPAVFNGRIDPPGDRDRWMFAAKQGETFDIDLRAARLGSPLDSVIAVVDAAGNELARADDLADGQTDSRIGFTAPADGVYRVEVQERFASRGGPRFAYRLRISPPPAADFRLTLGVDALNLVRGGESKLTVNAERIGGFPDAIALVLEGLPAGVTAGATTLPAGAASLEIVLKADAAAPIDCTRLTVRGTAPVAGRDVVRSAVVPAPRGVVPLDHCRLAVTLATPFKVKAEYVVAFAARGTIYRRHYTIDRGGFAGPLKVALADRQGRHLQGIAGPVIDVPAGESEFDYSVYMPPWMEIGRTSRSVVMAWGELADADGRLHTVSFSSQQQNEQIVMLVDPGPLGVQTEAPSILARTDQSVDLAVRVFRGRNVGGPVRVELVVPAHVEGIVCDPLTIPADQDRARMAVRFAPGAGPFNLPLVVRATGTLADAAVVAESKVDVVAAE
jgi:hypothetical protein